LLSLSLEGVLDNEQKLKEALQERFQWLWDIDMKQQAESAKQDMIQIIQSAI
jgi:hypothetical protein